MNGTTIRSLSGIRWLLPILLFMALLGMLCRGVLVVREAKYLQSALEATVHRQSVLTFLSPLYMQLTLEVDGLADGYGLALPSAQALGLERLSGLSEMFQRMVDQHGFEAKDIEFQVQTDNGQRFLEVCLPLHGRYRNLGPLLADVIRLPTLISIERISAVWHDDGDSINIELKMAVE